MNDEFKQPVNRNIYLQSPSEWKSSFDWMISILFYFSDTRYEITALTNQTP